MSEENVITRIRKLTVSQDPLAATSQNAIVLILEILVEAGPKVISILPALFPGNAIVSEAVAIYPTLLPILQRIEAALTGTAA